MSQIERSCTRRPRRERRRRQWGGRLPDKPRWLKQVVSSRTERHLGTRIGEPSHPGPIKGKTEKPITPKRSHSYLLCSHPLCAHRIPLFQSGTRPAWRHRRFHHLSFQVGHQTVATADCFGGQSARSTMKSPKSVKVGSILSPSIERLVHPSALTCSSIRTCASVWVKSHVFAR